MLQSVLWKATLAVGLVSILLTGPIMAKDKDDFGEKQEKKLHKESKHLFGFKDPLKSSADVSTEIARQPGQKAKDRQFLAKGLKAEFVARNVGHKADMISFWPDDVNYTHLIVCIEGDRVPSNAGNGGGQNPSVQRVNVNTGAVETILFGMSYCDGIRTTQWGTILATEEAFNGQAYEIIDPLTTTGHWVADRATGAIRTTVNGAVASTRVAKRDAMVTVAWEGLEVLDNGVVISVDEWGPMADEDGGSIFRFVPDTFYSCQGAPVRPGLLCENTIDNLNQSPLVAGENYALFIACSGIEDFGQGCEFGPFGRWVEVEAATAVTDARANGATGYCLPEDLHVDRSFGQFVGDDGIRWGWANACVGSGEVLFVQETSAALDAQNSVNLQIKSQPSHPDTFVNFLSNDGVSVTSANVTRFAWNDSEMSNFDNLDIQPITSNVYIIEDRTFGDIWACLPDGGDRDRVNDGCVRMLSVRDPRGAPSGFIFDGTGKVAYYNIQNGEQHPGLLDPNSNPTPGQIGFTDDLIKISGFIVKKVGNDK